MDILIQLIINGMMLGSMYAIISVGLTLIFGVVRVVNFAHGELLMIGMYAVYLLCTKLGLHPYVAAIPVVGLLFLTGVLIQRFIIQPLLDADEHIQIFATVGLSTALINLALMVFGADLYSVSSPDIRTSLKIGTYNVLVGQVVMFAAAIVLVIGLHAFMHRTALGRAIRATAQNRNAALLMGVRVNQIYVISFGLGAACVGLASALVSPLFPHRRRDFCRTLPIYSDLIHYYDQKLFKLFAILK